MKSPKPDDPGMIVETKQSIETMLEDKDVLVRRCRKGYEFFRSLRQRRSDLEAARVS